MLVNKYIYIIITSYFFNLLYILKILINLLLVCIKGIILNTMINFKRLIISFNDNFINF